MLTPGLIVVRLLSQVVLFFYPKAGKIPWVTSP